MNEERIRRELHAISKPQLSPGFAARVMDRIPAQRPKRSARILELVYWTLTATGSLAILSSVDWPGWTGYAILPAIPLSLWFTLSPEAALRPLRLLVPLFGRDDLATFRSPARG